MIRGLRPPSLCDIIKSSRTEYFIISAGSIDRRELLQISTWHETERELIKIYFFYHFFPFACKDASTINVNSHGVTVNMIEIQYLFGLQRLTKRIHALMALNWWYKSLWFRGAWLHKDKRSNLAWLTKIVHENFTHNLELAILCQENKHFNQTFTFHLNFFLRKIKLI